MQSCSFASEGEAVSVCPAVSAAALAIAWQAVANLAKHQMSSNITIGQRQVFCEGDKLKMDKHKAWATTIVATE